MQMLSFSISFACPKSPKPVISVIAVGANSHKILLARKFKLIIPDKSLSKSAFSSSLAFKAVLKMPVPSGLVSTKMSPALAVLLATKFRGCTLPVTLSPKNISELVIVCPPTSTAPASSHLSFAPCKSSISTLSSKFSLSKPTIFRAFIATPPIANMSLKEFAAAIAPK